MGLGWGVGDYARWNGVGKFLGWVGDGITYTIYSNKNELQKCKLAYFISELHKVIQIKKEV